MKLNLELKQLAHHQFVPNRMTKIQFHERLLHLGLYLYQNNTMIWELRTEMKRRERKKER